MWVASMFEEIDALPGAEGESATVDGNTQIDAGKHSPNVRWHVVGAFEGVGVELGVLGHQSLEVSLDIDDHIRVVVLLDGE